MSYATADDIATMFRNLDLTISNPALSQVEIEQFIEEQEAFINARIGTLYQLPITEANNPQSFKILKLASKYAVACIVDDILNDYAEADKKPQWCKKFTSMMNDLVPELKNCKQCEPITKLPDAIYLGTRSQKARISVSQTSTPVFTKGGDNW